MATILRKLQNVRNWDRKTWLASEDVQSRALKCLEAKENTLSIFVIDGEINQTSHEETRVVAALALTRDNLQEVDLALAPEDVLATCGIKHNIVEALTPDTEVNNWHRDLIELSVTKIAEFAKAIEREGDVRRIHLTDVMRAVQESFDNEWIDQDKVNPKIFTKLITKGIQIGS